MTGVAARAGDGALCERGSGLFGKTDREEVASGDVLCGVSRPNGRRPGTGGDI